MEPEITVIIIDDDLGSIQKLQNDLLAFSEVRILDTATTAELGKRHILKYQPDLVFWMWNCRTCLALICWMIYGMIFFRT